MNAVTAVYRQVWAAEEGFEVKSPEISDKAETQNPTQYFKGANISPPLTDQGNSSHK